MSISKMGVYREIVSLAACCSLILIGQKLGKLGIEYCVPRFLGRFEIVDRAFLNLKSVGELNPEIASRWTSNLGL